MIQTQLYGVNKACGHVLKPICIFKLNETNICHLPKIQSNFKNTSN